MVALPPSANFAIAPLGVAFDAWPPVLLYISLGPNEGVWASGMEGSD